MKIHPGNKVSDWIRVHDEKDSLNMRRVIEFNVYWLKKDPFSLLELYFIKSLRCWYISYSGRWDRAILVLHLPLWLLALVGLVQWRKRARGDPAYIYLLVIISYMWFVSAVLAGLARYSAPLYGFIGLFAGIPVLNWKRDRSSIQ
jgi:hypothetical protein